MKAKREKLSDQLRRLIEESPMTRYEISKRTGIANRRCVSWFKASGVYPQIRGTC